MDQQPAQPDPTTAPPSAAPAAAAAIPLPSNPSDAIYISFWQTPFAQNALPFITSALLHTAIIVIGIILARQLPVILSDKGSREQIIIPDAEMVSDSGEPGGIPHPGLGGDPTRDAAQDQFVDVPPDSKGLAEKAGPTLLPELMRSGGGAEESDNAAVIGIGPGTFSKGPGQGYGGAGENSGQLAVFGVPGGGGGIGPKSSFIGVGGNARKIIYVCDASGDMINVFDDVRIQLKKSIEALKPIQAFNIIFFRDDGVQSLDSAMIMATPANKTKAYKFTETAFCRGSTVPLPAVQKAFAQKPELIYVLTNGFRAAASPAEIEQEFKKLNPGNKVKVNMLVLYGGRLEDAMKLDKALFDVVERVSKESGGRFRLLSVDDVRNN